VREDRAQRPHGWTEWTLVKRVLALWVWSMGVWVLLTWTRTLSQLFFGLGISLAVALGCALLGPAAAPWAYLTPSRFVATVRLLVSALARIVRANISLARRIWTPSLPLRSGMVIVPTAFTSEGALAAVGLITSVIVDNQLVDLDVAHGELQYHGIWITSGDPDENRQRMNGPVETRLEGIVKQ
jgi:multicomponent Na+:H+ antiporter subunit E